MKQTKRLTRNQRLFLEERGIVNTKNIRFCKEDSKQFVYYDIEGEKTVVIGK